MSTYCGDPVLDFDLNFLHPTPSTGTVAHPKPDKQRKAIYMVKKKTIATDSLIKKYCDTKEALDKSEKDLLTAKEECKQICIDYRKSVDTCANLEKDLHQLKEVNKELELKCFKIESQFQAVNSHANQLQTLVKEHETRIEALKIENQLSKSNDKDYKKMLQPLQKENNMLIKHICLVRDIIFGKIKLGPKHKKILKQYDKYKSLDKDNNSLFGEEENNEDFSLDEISLSPFSEEYLDDVEVLKDNKIETMTVDINQSNISSISTNIVGESNDIASIDTGRGSSLALSVSDKSFHSPDYFNNLSPLSDDTELNKDKTKSIDSATSPVSFYVQVDVSTSPLIFENKLHHNHIVIDRALSPIALPTQADDNIILTNASDDIALNNPPEICKHDIKFSEGAKKQKERECLELNNSENISNENINDCEIEMILSTMRLHNELITPIPPTPAKSYSKDNIHNTPTKHQEQNPKVACTEAVLAREENKKLKASLSELAKEISNIKNMLINRPTIRNYDEESVPNVLCTENSVMQNHVSQSPPKVVTTQKTKGETSYMTERQSLHRKSIDVNMLEISNEELHTIPEVEEDGIDISALQCEDVTETINDNDVELELTDGSKGNVTRLEQSDNIVDSQSLTQSIRSKNKLVNKKKITKLGKFKQKLLPKLKIRREHLCLKKRSVKLKQLSIPNKKKITSADSAATLNNKQVYEKAVEVMSDLKRKKNMEKDCMVANAKNDFRKDHIDAIKYIDNQQQQGKCNISPEPIEMRSISTRSQSKAITSLVANKNLKLSNSETKPSNSIDCVQDHGKVNEKLESHLPERKRRLKRLSENILTDIPRKRVLRSFTLDCPKTVMEPKIILYRCKSVSDTVNIASYDMNKNGNKSSPKNEMYTKYSFGGVSLPKDTIKNLEYQESTSRKEQDITSHKAKRLNGIITSPQVNLKLLEKQENNPKCLSNPIKSVKDIASSDVNSKKSEDQGKSDISGTFNNRRRSGRNQSCSYSEPEEQDFTINRRRNIKVTSSPQVSPMALGSQERNAHKVPANRRDVIKHYISSPEVTSRESKHKESCNIPEITNKRRSARIQSFSSSEPEYQDSSSNRRENIKKMSSPQVSARSPIRQDRIAPKGLAHKRNEVKDCMLSPEVSPKLPDRPEIRDGQDICNKDRKIIVYDSDMITEAPEQQESCGNQYLTNNPRESVLCRMIEQYGVKSVKYRAKKVSDSITSSTAKKIEEDLTKILELPANEAKEAMDKFVMDIQHWNIKHFLAGLIKYLKDPTRKIELFNKVVATSAPPLTKQEQILLYVISELRKCCWADIVDKILSCIEFTLFSLNRTPQMEVIDSMSHFYAVICRYFKLKTRLRLFVLDAMYCIQYKAVPLIRQCIEVWKHILPLAHMAAAQTPLVTCLVYLLHFYKCDDKLNKVQEIRNILSRSYFYKITEWNETKILDLFRNSIKSLRGTPAETKMLRIALIILAKRHGPRWCQNNIVKNLLQPMIEKQNNPEHVTAFCVSMLGPLLKPYPADMKVHCEIVMNQLIAMLQEKPSPKIAEAIVTSLLYINRHNQFRVIQALVLWKPRKFPTELEVMLKDFVKSKPLKVWKTTLSKAVVQKDFEMCGLH